MNKDYVSGYIKALEDVKKAVKCDGRILIHQNVLNDLINESMASILKYNLETSYNTEDKNKEDNK